ncbi:DUF2971 domain-containing protein [Saccharibacillus sacchari]|uniref:DUF2971 domain-containing protein n=1 Tax=Saccharibacillus sacchari TaxID=456493 RepID=UPI0004AFB6AE|nr:DUF2971 domain-containing protein [Saccharibacillus sacchari]
MEWLNDFMSSYFQGNREEAYKIKKENIPSRLFKFQPIEDVRINSLLQNEIWFSVPKELNDPYDCMGTYWEEEEIEEILRKTISSENLKQRSTNEIINEALDSLRDHTKISCFSEELYNMPMWAHYANNHQGICVEYNFTSLNAGVDFSKSLFPVGYEKNRYNITDLLKRSFENSNDPKIRLLYFVMQLKHESWKYEKEWRIILHTENMKSGLVSSPIQPTAIYFGLNCREFEKVAKKIKDKFDCPIYKMSLNNSKFYHLDILNL